RREAAEQSLRVTQLSILREISRGFVGQLDPIALGASVADQLHAALGYDQVSISPDAPIAVATEVDFIAACEIRDADGGLGHLVDVADYEEGKARLAAGRPLCAFETTAVSGPSAGGSLAVTLSRSAGQLIAIVRDVTAQRELEQQLHQSEKLTALGQLAGGIA